MNGLLSRLDRRLGRFAIPNLTGYLVGLSALTFVLELMRPGYLRALALDPAAVKQGQVWRLVTYLFLPTQRSPLWMIFALLLLWSVGRALDEAWGRFKFNVYYLVGVIATTGAAFFIGGATNEYLNMSLFLAYATLFPEREMYLYFVPVRTKWLGLFAAAWLLYTFIQAGLVVRVAIGAAMLNYLLFFGGLLTARLRGKSQPGDDVEAPARDRPESIPPSAGSPAARQSHAPPKAARVCAICGLSDADDDVDIRVCTCQEVCGGKPTTYCLPHARNHRNQAQISAEVNDLGTANLEDSPQADPPKAAPDRVTSPTGKGLSEHDSNT